jgi:hypothetical protein
MKDHEIRSLADRYGLTSLLVSNDQTTRFFSFAREVEKLAKQQLADSQNSSPSGDRQAMSKEQMIDLCVQNPALASGLPLKALGLVDAPISEQAQGSDGQLIVTTTVTGDAVVVVIQLKQGQDVSTIYERNHVLNGSTIGTAELSASRVATASTATRSQIAEHDTSSTEAPSGTANQLSLIMVALHDAREVAMHNTAAARIPECGDFGRIAQNLDWAIGMMELAATAIAAKAAHQDNSIAPTKRIWEIAKVSIPNIVISDIERFARAIEREVVAVRHLNIDGGA